MVHISNSQSNKRKRSKIEALYLNNRSASHGPHRQTRSLEWSEGILDFEVAQNEGAHSTTCENRRLGVDAIFYRWSIFCSLTRSVLVLFCIQSVASVRISTICMCCSTTFRNVVEETEVWWIIVSSSM